MEQKNFRKRPVCAWISKCIILLPAVRDPSAKSSPLKNGVSGDPSAGGATSSRPVIPWNAIVRRREFLCCEKCCWYLHFAVSPRSVLERNKRKIRRKCLEATPTCAST